MRPDIELHRARWSDADICVRSLRLVSAAGVTGNQSGRMQQQQQQQQ